MQPPIHSAFSGPSSRPGAPREGGNVFQNLINGGRQSAGRKRNAQPRTALAKPGLYALTNDARDAIRTKPTDLRFDFPSEFTPQLSVPDFAKVSPITDSDFDQLRKGVLVGAFLSGRLYCATELEHEVDRQNALISMGEFELRTKYLPNINEDRSALEKLYFASLAPSDLPLYHFWLGRDEPDPEPQRMKDILDKAFEDELGPLPTFTRHPEHSLLPDTGKSTSKADDRGRSNKITAVSSKDATINPLPGDPIWEEVEAYFEKRLKSEGLAAVEQSLTAFERSQLHATTGDIDKAIDENGQLGSAGGKIQDLIAPTVAYKLTKLKLGRPVSPLQGNEALTRADEAQKRRARMGYPKSPGLFDIFEYGEPSLKFLDDYKTTSTFIRRNEVPKSDNEEPSIFWSPSKQPEGAYVGAARPSPPVGRAARIQPVSPTEIRRGHGEGPSESDALPKVSDDAMLVENDMYNDASKRKIYGNLGFLYLPRVGLREFLKAAYQLQDIQPNSKDWKFTVDVQSVTSSGHVESIILLSYEMMDDDAEMVFVGNVASALRNGNSVRLRKASTPVTTPFEEARGHIKFFDEHRGMFYSAEIWTKKKLDAAEVSEIHKRSQTLCESIVKLCGHSVSEIEVTCANDTKLLIDVQQDAEAFSKKAQRELDQQCHRRGYVSIRVTKAKPKSVRTKSLRSTTKTASPQPEATEERQPQAPKQNVKGKGKALGDFEAGARSRDAKEQEALGRILQKNSKSDGRRIKRCWDGKEFPTPVNWEQFFKLVIDVLGLDAAEFKFLVYEGFDKPDLKLKHQFSCTNEDYRNEEIFNSIDWSHRDTFAFIAPHWDVIEIHNVDGRSGDYEIWSTINYQELTDEFLDAAYALVREDLKQEVMITFRTSHGLITSGLPIPPPVEELERLLLKLEKGRIALRAVISPTKSHPSLDAGPSFARVGPGQTSSGDWADLDESFQDFDRSVADQTRLAKDREDSHLHQPSVYRPSGPQEPVFGPVFETRIGVPFGDAPTVLVAVPTQTEYQAFRRRLEKAENELLHRDESCRVCGVEFSTLNDEKRKSHYLEHQKREQGGSCAICGTIFKEKDPKIIADHFHDHHLPTSVSAEAGDLSRGFYMEPDRLRALLNSFEQVAGHIKTLYEEFDMIPKGGMGLQREDIMRPAEEEAIPVEPQQPAPVPPVTGKRKRPAMAKKIAKEAGDAEETDQAPAPKKKVTRVPRKPKAAETADGEEVPASSAPRKRAPPAPKKRAPPAPRKPKAEAARATEENDEAPAPKKQALRAPRKPKAGVTAEEGEPSVPKKRVPRKKAPVKRAHGAFEYSSDESEETSDWSLSEEEDESTEFSRGSSPLIPDELLPPEERGRREKLAKHRQREWERAHQARYEDRYPKMSETTPGLQAAMDRLTRILTGQTRRALAEEASEEACADDSEKNNNYLEY